MDHDDRLRRAVELSILHTANRHTATTLSRLRTVRGIGALLSRVLLSAIHDIPRFPRCQDCVASGRLVTCAKASAGQRYGTAGAKLGKAYLQWALSAAAGVCLRTTPAGQKSLARLEKNHGTGQALTVLAPTLARAVSHMCKRATAFEMPMLLPREEGAERVSLPPHWTSTR